MMERPVNSFVAAPVVEEQPEPEVV